MRLLAPKLYVCLVMACAMACHFANAQPYLSSDGPSDPGPIVYPLIPAPDGSVPWLEPLPPTGPPLVASPIAEAAEIVVAETDSPPDAPTGFWRLEPWTGSLEFGVNGSEGNSQTFMLHLGSESQRETPYGELTLEFGYSRGSSDGIESEHEAMFDGRHEWKRKKSPWSAFMHTAGEYDEFRAFAVRLSADAGVGYALINHEDAKLTARVGGGASREIGGPDENFVPEGLAGLEFKYQLSKRQKLLLSAEYFPDVSDLGDYRANGKAAWEILVDPEWDLNLKLSVTDRYDSTPNGAQRSDLDYALLLLWKY